MSWSLVSFALLEFAKSFWPTRTGAPGARDFLWVSLFVTFSAFLAYFSYSVVRSGGGRFEQVLLGAVPEHGIPVHLGVTFQWRGGLDARMQAEFKKQFPHLTVAPARNFALDDGRIGLAGLVEVADEQEKSGGTSSIPRPRAETPAVALPLDSPLWLRIAKRSGVSLQDAGEFPLLVAASSSVFGKQVSYTDYRAATLQGAPFSCALKELLPERISNWKELTHLVLRVREGPDRVAYHPFKVVWVDSFPLPEQVALIAPLSTFDLVEAASERHTELHLEGRGRAVTRISSVLLRGVDLDPRGVDQFQKFAGCLGAARSDHETRGTTQVWSIGSTCGTPAPPPRQSDERTIPQDHMPGAGESTAPGGDGQATPPAVEAPGTDRYRLPDEPSTPQPMEVVDLQLKLVPALPATYVDACIRTSGLAEALGDDKTRLGPQESERSMAFSWIPDGWIAAPCRALASSDMDRDELAKARRNEACRKDPLAGDGVVYLDGYRHVVVYVPPARGKASTISAATLDAQVSRLLQWQVDGKAVFRLAPTYEIGLVRYGVLSTLMETVSLPLGIGLALLYIWFSGTILATAFAHRRPQYGLLMTYGATTWGLMAVILAQIMMAAVIGGSVGYVMSASVVDIVNGLMSQSAAVGAARNTIGLESDAFLSNLSGTDAIGVWLLLTGLTMFVGFIILLASRIATARAPIDLLKLG